MTGNQALSINGFTNTVTTNNHITTKGSDWYFTATAIFGTASLVFAGLAFTKRRHERLFHYLLSAITLVAAISYFTMGSNLGWTAIQVEWQRSSGMISGNMRQIFYVRYIEWVITLPLLLLSLFLTAGLPTLTIIYTLLLNEVMVVCFLVGALVHSDYKWGYFVFALTAFAFVVYNVFFEGRAYARSRGNDISRTYMMSSGWLMLMWMLYPIAWGCSEGGNVISPDGEAGFYGAVDIMSMVVFGGLFLWGHRNIEFSRLNLRISDPSEGVLPLTEKPVEAPSTRGVSEETPA